MSLKVQRKGLLYHFRQSINSSLKLSVTYIFIRTDQMTDFHFQTNASP